MLIVGAKGFAKEVLEVCYQNNDLDNLVFYDDVNNDIGNFLYNQFPILHTKKQAEKYFNEIDNRFTIGIGNPMLRKKLSEEFIKLGGKLTSTISPNVDIGSFSVIIEDGANILSGVKISNNVRIGKSVLMYYNTIVTHDCIIGDFVELSPSSILLGNCVVGNFTHVGANSTILPNINIGKNVIIGAGSVVTKNIPNNCTAVGIPAKILKNEK